jgi:hypothetical protein
MPRNDEFNREMDGYLRSRRVIKRTNPFLSARNYFKTFLSAKPQRQEQPLEDIPQEHVQAVLAGKRVQTTTPQTRSTPTQARQQPKVNNMGWFTKKRQDDDYEMMEGATQTTAQPVLDEEVKDVLKITFKWLKMMDPETIDEIKRSPDFEKYKKVLDKYGLIKK